MKRFLALLVALCCTISFCTVFAGAEDVYDDDFIYDDDYMGDDGLGDIFEDMFGDMDVVELMLSGAMASYYTLAELMDGYFALGDSPIADIIVLQTEAYVAYNEDLEEYIVASDEYGWFVTYHIPSEIYEEFVFTDFTYSDAIVETLRNSHYYNADGDYYVIEIGGGFGDYIPEFAFYGYNENDDGSYTAYGYLVEIEYDEETFEVIPYEPKEGDVEGVDYIYMPDTWFNMDEVPDGAMTFDDIKQYSGYRAYKLAGFIESVLEYDEDLYNATISSFEKKIGEMLPDEDELITPVVSEEMMESAEALAALINGVYADFEGAELGRGVVLSTEKITKGDAYNAAAAALDGVTESFAAFEFIATENGEAVELTQPMKVVMAIPVDFSAEFGIFSIAPDGTLTELTQEINMDMGVVTTYISQLGTIVLADAPVVSTPETNAPETNAPETDAPETNAPETDTPETDPETTVPELEKAPVKSPQTGDNMAVVTVVMVMALAACAVVVLKRKAVR